MATRSELKRLTTIGAFLFLCSCNNSGEGNPTTVENDTVLYFSKTDTFPVITNSWEKTLDMYLTKSDSIELVGVVGSPVIRILDLNNIKTAFVIDSGMLKIYKLGSDGRFVQNSSEAISGIEWEVKITDLNFDGLSDIMLSEIEGAHGNSFTTALIFDPKLGAVVHKTSFDLPNLQVKASEKALRTQWYNSVCGVNSKALYTSRADSVELLMSIAVIPDCSQGQEKLRLAKTIKKMNDSLVSDTIILAADSAWDIFKKAFWNSEMDN